MGTSNCQYISARTPPQQWRAHIVHFSMVVKWILINAMCTRLRRLNWETVVCKLLYKFCCVEYCYHPVIYHQAISQNHLPSAVLIPCITAVTVISHQSKQSSITCNRKGPNNKMTERQWRVNLIIRSKCHWIEKWTDYLCCEISTTTQWFIVALEFARPQLLTAVVG